MLRLKRCRADGFTLVELLVVMAIISVLAAMLLPALQSVMKQARAIACINNLRQSGLAMTQYADDFSGWIPGTSFNYKNNSSLYMANGDKWSGLLCVSGYIGENYTVLKTRSGSGVPAILRHQPNSVVACPSLRPTSHLVENISFGAGEISSSSTYGVRGRWGGYSFQGDRWIEVPGGNECWLLKNSAISLKVPYMSDTAYSTVTNGESVLHQCFGFAVATLNLWSGKTSGIDTRHSERANAWFPDGSVRSMDAVDLLTADGNTTNTAIISQTFQP